MRLSIIIPAHNEEKRVSLTLKRYLEFFKKLKREKILDFEIIIVLNACIDNTKEAVERYKCKELKILEFELGGKGFAIIQGFNDALKRKNDLIGFVDADMATSPEAFYDLVKNIGDYEGIIASRWLKESIVTKRSLLRRITSGGFNFVVRVLFLVPFKDTQCGAKIFKREIIEIITPLLNLTRWAFDVNLLFLCKKHRFRIKEHPTIWEDKQGSQISNIPKISMQMFLGVIRLRLIHSFLEPILKPIKFILRLGNRLINK